MKSACVLLGKASNENTSRYLRVFGNRRIRPTYLSAGQCEQLDRDAPELMAGIAAAAANELCEVRAQLHVVPMVLVERIRESTEIIPLPCYEMSCVANRR